MAKKELEGTVKATLVNCDETITGTLNRRLQLSINSCNQNDIMERHPELREVKRMLHKCEQIVHPIWVTESMR